jgi:hypothetical protein
MLRVYYKRGQIVGDTSLTILHSSIAYTIAEYESRNRDIIITHYMNADNVIIEL